jgi:hypothetical protein
VHSIGGWIVLNATELHVRNVVRLSFALRFPSKAQLEALGSSDMSRAIEVRPPPPVDKKAPGKPGAGGNPAR